MRISYVTCALLAIAGVASAEPCEVTIARAPADVRTAIETALAAEPHCRVALELRVVATADGYYMLARDLHGRVRERIVPDVASAATLVTSWAADDELDEPIGRVVRMPLPPPAPAFAPVDQTDTGAPSSPPPPSGAFLGVYGLYGPNAYGVRGELDLYRRGPWTLGAVVAGVHHENATPFTDDLAGGQMEYGTLETTDFDLLGYASYQWDLTETWHIRGTLGAGAALVQATLEPIFTGSNLTWEGMLQDNATGMTALPLADASISLDADVGHGFSLVAGVIVDAYFYSPTVAASDDGAGYHVPLDRSASWFALGGLRYAL
ncbi:MAG TPA: hypothetical protein VGG74_29480 [Kofleriaceae bacterium]|jgi:hypothetical protein